MKIESVHISVWISLCQWSYCTQDCNLGFWLKVSFSPFWQSVHHKSSSILLFLYSKRNTHTQEERINIFWLKAVLHSVSIMKITFVVHAGERAIQFCLYLSSLLKHITVGSFRKAFILYSLMPKSFLRFKSF